MSKENLLIFNTDSLKGKSRLLHTALSKLTSNCSVEPNDISDLFPRSKIEVLKGGFNLDITGGGIYQVTDTDIAHKPFSTVLKISPPFTKQQENMLKMLNDRGLVDFAQILKQYPSNKLSEREIRSYLLMNNQDVLQIPQMYLAVIDELTEMSWIFLEDITHLVSFRLEVLSNLETYITNVIKDLAAFHSLHWNQDMSEYDWLGRWWSEEDNSDFMAEDVNTYALELVIGLYPEEFSTQLIKFLISYVKTRRTIQTGYQDKPNTVIHWDAGPHNMAFNPTTKKATVFDWELTSIGMPQWDLVQFLLPLFSINEEDVVQHYLRLYLDNLPSKIRDSIDTELFFEDFDWLVLDHFIRACGPIIFAGKDIDKSSHAYTEWIHCLNWIKKKFVETEK